MSELGSILKSAAHDAIEGAQKAGKAVAEHFDGIGDELKKAAGRYRGAEESRERRFRNLYPGGKDAEQAASRASTRTAASIERGGGAQAGEQAGSLAAESEQEAAFTAHEHGSGGATDDPIDVVTGQMFLPQRDLALPGVLPLVLERRHGSAYRRGRWFGTNWASSLDQRVEIDEDGIHFATADGRVLHYPVPTAHGQRVLPSHGPRWPLSWNRTDDVIEIEQGETGCALRFPPGPTPQAARALSVILDRAGNRITIVCDAQGVPRDVYHSGGYHVVVSSVETRGGIRIDGLKLADPGGGADTVVREFRYDLAGRLTGVVNASGQPLLFAYDDADRITKWIDRNGFEYSYHYRQDGRVTHAGGSGEYLSVRLDYDLSARTTTVTDALGHATVHHWNDRLQTVNVRDPLGGESLTEKDRYGQVISSTDPLGRTTRIARNSHGDPVLIAQPDGAQTAITYNERRQPVAVNGPDGAAWRYTYAHSGALAEVTDPGGAVTRYGRDENGRIVSVTDPLGGVSLIGCDRAGLPVRISDPLGGTCTLRRDAFGRISQITDAAGAVTTLSWTREGQLAARVLPDGASEQWEYDPEGNLLAHTGPTGAVTRFEHGPFDVPVARIEPTGERYTFNYDAQLRLTEVGGPGGRWRYEYDAAGNLIAETDFNGATRTYNYDAAGQLIRQVNAVGQDLLFERDILGRVTTRRTGAVATRFDYDPAGNITRAERPGVVVECTRDATGRLLCEAVNGRTLTNTFDAAGQRITRTTPTGALSHWTFDQAGRPAALSAAGQSLTFAYDDAGRETTRTLGPAASLTQSFDDLGRLTAQGIWAYDQPTNPGAQGVWRALQTRTYAYRPDGLPTEVGDLLRGTRAFTLDPAGRVTAVNAATWRESYAYDALGNLAHADAGTGSAADGEREATGTLVRQAGRTRYEYDGAGRLKRRIRRTLSGQIREWTYTWDAEDHLLQVITPNATTWHYTYDPFGRRVAKQAHDPGGTPVGGIWFTWDGPRLAEQIETHPDGRTTVLTWDCQPGTYTPAAQTRRTWASNASQDEIDLEFHAIVTDLVGTPTELVTPDGQIAWHTTTSLWGQTITAPASSAECPLRFPGQYHDDETGLNYSYHRYYDPDTAAFLSPDPLGLGPAPNDHAYVDNPLGWIDPMGLAGCRYTTGNGATPESDPWDDLAAYRRSQGMPAQGSIEDQHTAARLDIDGESFYGRNGHGMPTDIKVNAQTKTHAEGQAFQRAKNFFTGQGAQPPKSATLHVDRDFCRSCGPNGGVGSLMRGLGIDSLTVHSPSGTFIVDATKRPSIPVPVPGT